jgi:hypothetical protein
MIKNFFKKIFSFLKKWGLFGVLGYITLFIPLGLGYLLSNVNLRTTGLVIAAIVAAPNGLGLLFTIIIAALYKWLWKIPILGFIAWAKETMLKIQTQNQLGLYYDSEEIQILLDMGKKLKDFSDDEKLKFSKRLKTDRLKMIDEQWSKEVKQNDKET